VRLNVTQALSDMDKHAVEFDFPVLDNAYLQYAASRLTALRSDEHWLITFEVLGFSEREVEFVNDLYAFGSCVPRQGFIEENILFDSHSNQPLFDPVTNDFVADSKKWTIARGAAVLSFAPSLSDYQAAGLAAKPGGGLKKWREIELLRYLVSVYADSLFLTVKELVSRFPACGSLAVFLQTREWEHPDVAASERPSQKTSVRTLMKALAENDVCAFDPGRPNTHWRFWQSDPD